MGRGVVHTDAAKSDAGMTAAAIAELDRMAPATSEDGLTAVAAEKGSNSDDAFKIFCEKASNTTTKCPVNISISSATQNPVNATSDLAAAEDDTTLSSAAADAGSAPFYRQVLALAEKLQLISSRDQQHQRPVIEFRQPAELAELITLPLQQPPLPESELLQLCRQVAEFSVRTGDFRFRNQLYGGVDRYGMTGALLTELLNTNQHTFEAAPVFTVCEAAVLARVRGLLGWQSGDGIMAPGGSMANQYGLALARYRKHPEVKQKGMFGLSPLVVFTSEEGHYSIQKAAHWHGYGLQNMVAVATDLQGAMRADALREAVLRVKAEGREPLIACATSGTTVLGGFDPLPALADVCAEFGLWLHVDAAWGGAALLSSQHRYLLAGAERADSLVWNAHKLLGAPLQCSLFVTRHAGLLHACNAASASYLFQQDKFYDVSFDSGDKAIQCGRKVDAFKLWLMWKAYGDAGLERMVDATLAAAEYCGQQVKRRAGFRPVLDQLASQGANVCFWYIPAALRGLPETAVWWSQLGQVAPKLKEAMVRRGSLMVGYQPLPHRGLVNFFRLVFTAVPQMGKEEVDYILDEIDALGRGIKVKLE